MRIDGDGRHGEPGSGLRRQGGRAELSPVLAVWDVGPVLKVSLVLIPKPPFYPLISRSLGIFWDVNTFLGFDHQEISRDAKDSKGLRCLKYKVLGWDHPS